MTMHWLKHAFVMFVLCGLANAAWGQVNSESHATLGTIGNAYYTLTLDEKSGSLSSFRANDREFIHASNAARPAFILRFRDSRGEPLDITSLEARQVTLSEETTADGDVVTVNFRDLGGKPIHASMRVRCPLDQSFSYWNLSVEHDLEGYLDWIEYPAVTVPNDLAGPNGDARLFWPAMEGSLIDDVSRRDKGWCRYHPIEFPNRGWEGFYPGPCQMQFMAYYNKAGGLYLAAHDPGGHPKGIDFYPHDGGIVMEYRMYPGGIGRGRYTVPYDMVLGVFAGDWHDAADIYRRWVTESGPRLGPKLHENRQLPDWFKDSPVVVTYPVRGTRDMGDMSPNAYYPYTHALPHLERLAEAFDSKVLALLMHWEGTAPWAPPYVWPPFGGETDFTEFGRRLHARGNLLGVYCSGIAWTQKSNLWPYRREEQFEREHLRDIMIAAPNGDVVWSLICSGEHGQRWSYDMCPTNPFVGQVVTTEIEKMVRGGCDYIQYFDQNLGGTCYFCYSRHHGHPPAPGPWMKDAMLDLFEQTRQAVQATGRQAIIGCEAAAAEPYIAYMAFNDLRSQVHFQTGTPVPAYAYVFHEYANNFSGNQAATMFGLDDSTRSLTSFLQRLTYGFVAGDMLTVLLQGGGRIHWDWGTDWGTPAPDQASVIALIRNFNAWRKGVARPFLHFGRMEKPFPLEGVRNIPLDLKHGDKLPWPSLMTSRWTSPDGRKAQMVANYLPESQSFVLRCGVAQDNRVRVYDDLSSDEGRLIEIENGRVPLTVAPLSAVMIEAVR